VSVCDVYCIGGLFNYLNCIYLARLRFTFSRILFYIRTTTVPHSCASLVRVGSKDFVGAEEREDDKKQRALRGCGPNYPQWLLKTKKKNLTMSLGGRKDGATGFFSSFSFSICQQPFARERVESILSDSFTSCSANGTSRTAVRYSRIRVGETEMQNILLYCATLLNFEKYAL